MSIIGEIARDLGSLFRRATDTAANIGRRALDTRVVSALGEYTPAGLITAGAGKALSAAIRHPILQFPAYAAGGYVVAAGFNMVGSALIDSEHYSNYYGKRIYSETLGHREQQLKRLSQLAGMATFLGASIGVPGSRALTRGFMAAGRKFAAAGRGLRALSTKRRSLKASRIKAIRRSLLSRHPIKLGMIAPLAGGLGAGIAAGGYLTHFSPKVRPWLAEGRITWVGQKSPAKRLNYSTAGLVQALHRSR